MSSLLKISIGLFLTTTAFAATHLRVSETTQLREIGPNTNGSTVTQVLSPDQSVAIDLHFPVELSSENKLPVILVPVYQNTDLTVDAPNKKDVLEKISEEQVSSLLSSIMGDLADIQNLMRKQQLEQAMHGLVSLETKYPNVKFLEFTRASILLLQGNREEAKRVASEASAALPNYQEGQRFLKSLGQKTSGEKNQ